MMQACAAIRCQRFKQRQQPGRCACAVCGLFPNRAVPENALMDEAADCKRGHHGYRTAALAGSPAAYLFRLHQAPCVFYASAGKADVRSLAQQAQQGWGVLLHIL